MYRRLSNLSKVNSSTMFCSFQFSIYLKRYSRDFSTSNPIIFNKKYQFITQKKQFYFSSQSTNKHSRSNQHGHGTDPIIAIRQQLQGFSKQVQSNNPNQPHTVIQQLYGKCQQYIGQNKKIEILILFEIISEFIEANNLVEKYSAFLINSANNSFLTGKYKDVEKRAKTALKYEINKHGEKHKNIADIYNMLGIAISKIAAERSQQALKYLQKAFVIRKQLFGQSGQAAEVLFNMGIIEEENQKMLQKAQLNYLDSIQMLENCKIPNPLLYLKVKLRLSDNQSKLHLNKEKNISDLLRIEQLADQFQSLQKFQRHEKPTVEMLMSLLHRNLGKKYFEVGNYVQAIKYFEKCLIFLRQNKMQNEDRIKVLESCAVAYASLGRYQKTIQLLEQINRIFDSYPSNAQYKYELYKYLCQVYRKTIQTQKQKSLTQKIRILLSNTKQSFITPQVVIETQIRYLWCLTNNKDYREAIQIGQKLLGDIENHKSSINSQQSYLQFKSNTLGLIGYTHSSSGKDKASLDKAIDCFVRAEQIFSSLPQNPQRFEFQINMFQRMSTILIKLKKDFIRGFFYLKKCQNRILSQQNTPLPQKLNDLFLLFLSYDFSQQESLDVNNLIEAKYIQNICQLLGEFVKIIEKVSATSGSKQFFIDYLAISDPLHQIISSFEMLQVNDQRVQIIARARQQLIKLIGIFQENLQKQFMQVEHNTFTGDQTKLQFIKRTLKVRNELIKSNNQP